MTQAFALFLAMSIIVFTSAVAGGAVMLLCTLVWSVTPMLGFACGLVGGIAGAMFVGAAAAGGSQ